MPMVVLYTHRDATRISETNPYHGIMISTAHARADVSTVPASSATAARSEIQTVAGNVHQRHTLSRICDHRGTGVMMQS